MIGDEIKALRKNNGMSQQALADSLGISQSTVAMWESGRNSPGFATLEQLSRLFGSELSPIGRRAEKELHKIPVLGYVRAGLPSEAIENVLDYEDVYIRKTDSENYFALKIKGDSMAPRMMEGDTVIVKKDCDCENGDICVAMVGTGDATVKKLIKKDMGMILMPLNPSYEPLVFTKEEAEEKPVTILGKVVELRSRF